MGRYRFRFVRCAGRSRCQVDPRGRKHGPPFDRHALCARGGWVSQFDYTKDGRAPARRARQDIHRPDRRRGGWR